MEVDQLIKLYDQEKGSSERGNFNTLYESMAEWCNPRAADIQTIKSAGERVNTSRLIDIGLKARRMFTAGMMTHLFPDGQGWIRVTTKNRELMDNDNVNRAMSSVSRKFVNRIQESNFYEEMGQNIEHCSYIGTTMLYCEGTKTSPLNWRAHYINKFYFLEDYEGKVDTTIREFDLTARQAVQQFGDDCTSTVKEQSQNVSTAEKTTKYLHIVMPRSNYSHGSDKKTEKPIASYYINYDEKILLSESGYDEMPYFVARFYKTNYEKHGRSPAMEVYSTLPMINRMEVSRIRGAERVSNPPWLSPNDGSVRRISNRQGSIIYWNAANPMSKPEQLQVRDNVIINDEMIKKKEEEVLDAFYIPLFNPLLDRKNLTAYEASERINLSMQFLAPAVNRLNKYFIRPAMERAFSILQRNGEFPELDIPELSEEEIDFDLVGKASLAGRQIELYSTMTALEQTGLVGQVKPEVWDNWDADETAKFIQDVNMVPVQLQNSSKKRDEERAKRAAEIEQQRAQQATQTLSDAYAKTQKTPEEGSGAEAISETVEAMG